MASWRKTRPPDGPSTRRRRKRPGGLDAGSRPPWPTTGAPGVTSRSTPSTLPSPRASTAIVGSVETGKLADLVLWEPKFFGVKPHMVIKGGQIAYAQVGDANASIPTPQPVLPRADVGLHRPGPGSLSFNFVTERASTKGLRQSGRSGLNKQFRPSRTPGGQEGRHEGERRDPASVEIDPDTYEVIIGGAKVTDVTHRSSTTRSSTAPSSPNSPWPSGTSSSETSPQQRSVHRRHGRGRPYERWPRPMNRAALFVLADGRFPAGGHAHSGGAEAAVAAGRIKDAAAPGGVLPGHGCTPRAGRGGPGRRGCAPATIRWHWTRPPTPAPPSRPCGPPPASSAAR